MEQATERRDKSAYRIYILALLLLRQRRADAQTWAQAMQSAFGAGMPIYVAWALVVVLALPWLFR